MFIGGLMDNEIVIRTNPECTYKMNKLKNLISSLTKEDIELLKILLKEETISKLKKLIGEEEWW